MEQIKIFCKKANLPSALEAQVNDFLSENETKISVKDIQYTTATTVKENSDQFVWSAMVRYEVL